MTRSRVAACLLGALVFILGYFMAPYKLSYYYYCYYYINYVAYSLKEASILWQ